MIDIEKNKQHAGAPDYRKQLEEIERQIRSEVERDLGHLPPAAREAVIQSRIGIAISDDPTVLVKVDLGENAGKKVKGNLFE